MIYCSDNTIFKTIFGVSMMIKQSEDDHFKDLYVIYEVMSGNLQNIEVKQLNQTNLVVYPPQSAFIIRGNLIDPKIGSLPFSDVVNWEVSLFRSHKGCHVWVMIEQALLLYQQRDPHTGIKSFARFKQLMTHYYASFSIDFQVFVEIKKLHTNKSAENTFHWIYRCVLHNIVHLSD